MSPEEVENKAAWLMEPVLGKRNVDQIIESIRRIEALGSARDLTKPMILGNQEDTLANPKLTIALSHYDRHVPFFDGTVHARHRSQYLDRRPV